MFVVTVAAAMLAAWLLARVPRLVPSSSAAASAWTAAALACGIAAHPLIALITDRLGPVAAALLVVLPGGVCVFLAVGVATVLVVRELHASE